jgi:tetratricopeptide (TPR) repeat protein
MQSERDIQKLIALIKEQGLETKDEIKNFMKSMEGKSFDELPKKRGAKNQAQDLVYDAYEQSPTQGKKLVKKALELDPNNADAYVYLASLESDIEKAMALFEKAIRAGKESLGEKFFEEERGHFWGMMESRPYMRAMAGLADCLVAKDETDKAIEIYEELLALNPRDNQGIRYSLSSLLLGKTDLSKFQHFIKTWEKENCAVWNYNAALYQFKKTGITTLSERELVKAFKQNRFVLDYLLGIKKLPKALPEYIGRGDENEAVAYVNSSWEIWRNTKGALEWLYSFKAKGMKKQ